MLEHLPIKRRRVLRGLLVGGLAAFAAPFVYVADRLLSYRGILGGKPTAEVPVSELTRGNPSVLVEVEEEPVIVVREPGNQLRAFTATCTHLGCIVNYRPQMPIGSKSGPGFYCRCHGGKFYANGVNVPGTPPRSPLTELTIVTKGDKVIVSFPPSKS